MTFLPVFRSARLAALLLATSALLAGAARAADVLVYGGTAGGVIAAVQAARMGKSVVLVESSRHLGGMTSSGLGLTDMGQTATIGGVADEFYARIYRYYREPRSWHHGTRADFVAWMPLHWGVDGRKTEQLQRMYVFEPHAAEEVFRQMAREAGVEVVYGERLQREGGVAKAGGAITGILMESGRRFVARMYIDATYEGDLMAAAGVRYVIGREPNSRYGETLNGKFPKGSTRMPVDPYVIPGDARSGLLPPIAMGPGGAPGEGDGLVQSYNFRLCLTDVPENRLPVTKPQAYDPRDYELLARYIAAKRDSLHVGISRTGPIALAGNNKDLGIKFDLMPNRKTDCNDGSPFGSDLSGGSQGWPEGSYAEREKIWQRHQSYLQGLLWFLGNDPRVPEAIREAMRQWGYARDEFVDNGGWPFQLYVREARRMVSDYVVTEHDARHEAVADDPVALASYPLDSHSGRYYVDDRGSLWRESGFYVPCRPFGVSYRAIRPSRADCTNLLVTGCVSTTHAAYGSVRMEPVFMMLGQACATAASVAIDHSTAVQDVSYAELSRRLVADRQILAEATRK